MWNVVCICSDAHDLIDSTRDFQRVAKENDIGELWPLVFFLFLPFWSDVVHYYFLIIINEMDTGIPSVWLHNLMTFRIRFIYSLFYSVVSLPLLSHCSIVTLMMIMRCCAMLFHVGSQQRDGQLLPGYRSFFLLYVIIIFSVFLLFVVWWWWWCSSLTVYDCRNPYSTVLDRRSRSCHPL